MHCSIGNAADPPVDGARLVPMEKGDLKQVVAIERASFASPWRPEHFLYEIRDNRWAVNRVLRLGDEVLAYSSVWELHGELKINNIAVRADRRRGGLGRWLLMWILDEARQRGCTVARLEVRPSNRAALGLYREQGFREVGRRKGYYQCEGEDALLMEADL